MAISNPFHEGEMAIQKRSNETEMARINSGAIDETILAGALRFIEQQPMVVIGSMDPQGKVWVSALFGNPGFICAPDKKTLALDISQPRSAADEPLWGNLRKNPNVGLLVIDLGTRRRIRINGRARKVSAERIIIDVEQAYPNCPKYIQRRVWKTLEPDVQHAARASTIGEKLTKPQQELIAIAETMYVASAHPEFGVDASHRGGHPGFVAIVNNQQLRIPDFVGNSMFNTLGNFTSYPFAGLIFIDFKKGKLLQLTGKAEILWDMDDPNKETGGTRRYWQFDITSWLESTLPYRFAWEFLGESPHIPELKYRSDVSDTHLLQVERIQQETDRIKSFHLRATDGKKLPEVQPGAHLQLKVKLPDGSDAIRHYSLLNHPDDYSSYEIAVLKEPQGRGGSLYLHEQVCEGDTLEFQIPKNAFPMAIHANHSILIAGGIGITPIISMMQQLSSKKQSYEMHYSAHMVSGLAYRDRIEQIAGESANFYASNEIDGQRLDLNRILATPRPGVHVYVCGPRGLINSVREIAEARRWPATCIHFESFGVQPLADDKAVCVHLYKSNKTIKVPEDRSILEILLAAGISVPHDCKRGECAMCITRLIEGEPDHRDLCLSAKERETSMCVCVSRARSKNITLFL